jgi:hypothetical protein
VLGHQCRKAIALAAHDAGHQRRQALETAVSLNKFIREKAPQLYEEWNTIHQKS